MVTLPVEVDPAKLRADIRERDRLIQNLTLQRDQAVANLAAIEAARSREAAFFEGVKAALQSLHLHVDFPKPPEKA